MWQTKYALAVPKNLGVGVNVLIQLFKKAFLCVAFVSAH